MTKENEELGKRQIPKFESSNNENEDEKQEPKLSDKAEYAKFVNDILNDEMDILDGCFKATVALIDRNQDTIAVNDFIHKTGGKVPVVPAALNPKTIDLVCTVYQGVKKEIHAADPPDSSEEEFENETFPSL